MEYGYIYITTNKINNKKYIGQHKGTFDSKYFGSGLALKRAIEKYGAENFKVDVIEVCESLYELNYKEIEYIKKFKAVSDPDFYNIASGGLGNTGNKGVCKSDSHKEKISKSHKGKKLSAETRLKISEANSGEKHWNYGNVRSVEVKNKISASLKGTNHPNYGKRGEGSPNFGNRHSKETKEKMSNSHKGKTHSENAKNKISKSKQGVKHKIVKCPYCEKSGGLANMKRYHFKNCKKLKNSS